MIDLTKKNGLPDVIEIHGSLYSIDTDFRKWIRFTNEVQKLKQGDSLDVSYLFINEMPIWCDIVPLLEFCNPKSELPRKNSSSSEIIFDFEIDADYIYSAFLSQYGIDLVDIEYLHWYKFLALFKGLKDNEMICKIMGYRSYEKTDTKKDVYAELKEKWRIEKTSPEEQTELEKFSNMFS